MLIRVAPDMFMDSRYETITLPSVVQELIRTQKFQSKYPWRSQFRPNFRPIPATETEADDYRLILSTIDQSIKSGVMNFTNGRLFDLSKTDKEVVSFALANGYAMSTGDQGVIDFATQEFSEDFKGNISPLELIIIWLEKGLFGWDDERHNVLQEWSLTEERPQPQKAKTTFCEMTGRLYPGP